METCEVCGFGWDAITAGEVPTRMRRAADGYHEALTCGDPRLTERPDPETWSAVECASHARDVLYNLRDRIVLGLAEDNPVPKALYTDLRVASGLYAREQPSQLADDMLSAAGIFARTIEAMDDDQLARPVFYGWPREATRSLLWVAAQALHEVEHHLDDVRERVA